MASKSNLLTDRIGDEIERLLSGDEIEIGDKLPSERELAVQLGVSRPVVREALRRLQERGLVEVQPGRGTFYRPADPADAAGSLNLLIRRHVITPAELIAARKMLECEAAALAAVHRTDDDCAILEQILARFANETGVLDRATLDIAFHDRIAQASANPVIRLMFASISDITVGLMVRSLSDRQVSRQGLPLHEKVCAAIIAHEPERARTAMAEHLSAAEQLYGADLQRNIGDLIPHDLRDALSTLGISPGRDGDLR